MWLCKVFVLFLFINISSSEDEFLYDTFPEGFIWSVATSAYQIEGAWDTDGKGRNIWDEFVRRGGTIEDGSTGDVACDSYNKYTEDVQLMQTLGIPTYRFSISWSRLLPSGTASPVEERGVAYYNRLIDSLLAANIQPVVTLYHWDLPQPLMDIGGWENEALVQHFTDYANLCFERFGDRVKHWITFNEPWVVCWNGYGAGAHAPGIRNPGTAPYRCGHTILKSHAEAYHLYNDNYRASQQGNISITIDSDWKEPEDTQPSSIAAAERAQQFKLGWFANPIFGSGDYPQIMKDSVGNRSAALNMSSRLPAFTPTEVSRILGTHDFFGLNHYTTQLVRHCDQPLNPPSYYTDQNTCDRQHPDWPTSGSSWLKSVPWGFRKLLNYIKNNYNDPPILVTENGVSDRNSSIQDTHRVEFYRLYINNALKAIRYDNVTLIGYTAWSLMDNFEWAAGYLEKFGMTYVDFSNPARPRTPKDSAAYYSQIVGDNGFVQP